MRVKNTIYLDHQATTPLDPLVLERMRPYLEDQFGNPHSSEHFMGWQAAKAVETARGEIAAAVNADSDEIFFTSGATESNNLAMLGPARHSKSKARNKIFVSAVEHKCVLTIARSLANDDKFEIVKIPVASDGVVDLNWLEEHLDTSVLLISVMAVNNEIGTIQPIEQVGKLCRQHGVIYHCDAAQAVGVVPLDVEICAIDLMSLSAHKVYGPKGIGALYVRREIQSHIQPILYGGGQENGLRGGTLPTHLCVGAGVAFTLATESTDHVSTLRNTFIETLKKTGIDFRLNGPPVAQRHPGNANICFIGYVAQDILTALQPSLAASSGSACTSGITEPSYVLREIGLSVEDAEASIRFSFGKFSTSNDVNSSVELLKEVLASLSL